MDTQAEIVKQFAADLPDILAGKDPTSDADYCKRCGMSFHPVRKHTGGHVLERTVCAEPGCGRWFAHGMCAAASNDVSNSPFRAYKL